MQKNNLQLGTTLENRTKLKPIVTGNINQI